MKAYEALHARFEQIDALEGAGGILSWDSATTMPPKGASRRAVQMAALQGVTHRLLTAPEVRGWLDKAEGEVLDEWRAANLRRMRQRVFHATAVPGALVERLARVGSECEFTWRGAKQDNDFARLLPHLQEVVTLVREVAAVKAEALGLSLYDALLDGYDPGRRSADIDRHFAVIERELPPLLAEVEARQAALPPLPAGPFAREDQKALGLQVMRAVGFDFEGGRLDVSVHPFCSGAAGDIRITARYHDEEWFSSLMAIIHETGHALYEQGLPQAWAGQPVGQAHGMSLHESQSLSLEMQLARSRAFLQWLSPRAEAVFGGKWPAEALYRHATRVQRSFIRVEADEVTYPLHILLRYRLEQALLGGALEVRDLPEAWREGMKARLGIVPPDDAQGCLQDIHWMDGSFGYFPTYTLGAMIAAQFFQAMKRELPDFDRLVARGEFAPVLGWLRDKVHRHGAKLDADPLVEQATGEPLDARYFIAHLRGRYLD